jgi:hypothetical protein
LRVNPSRRLGAAMSHERTDVLAVDRGQDELPQDLAHGLLVRLRERCGFRLCVAGLVHQRPVRVARVARAGEVDGEEDQRRGCADHEGNSEHAAAPAR